MVTISTWTKTCSDLLDGVEYISLAHIRSLKLLELLRPLEHTTVATQKTQTTTVTVAVHSLSSEFFETSFPTTLTTPVIATA